MKVEQISTWRKARLGDATVISESLLIASGLQQYLENPKDSKLRRKVLTWMTSLQKNYDYGSVVLLDENGVVRLSAPEKIRHVFPYIQQNVTEALRTNKIILTDLHQNESADGVHLGIVIPLPASEGNRAHPISVILLQVNPYQFLYPLIQSWPTPSRTSETLLVRREGNEVVYLNELRHQKNTALNLRFPLSKLQLPAAMVVQGKEGVVEGLDYRGLPVFAAIRSIPESPWFIVAKVDKEEIYKPIHERAWIVAILSSLVIGFAGITLVLVWRHQRAKFYRKLYEGELEREKLTQQLDTLTKHANDIIVLLDDERKIVDVNDRAMESYGYTRDELLQKRGEDLRPPEMRPLFDAQIGQVNEHNGFLYETVHQKKDGTTFPVEVSSRPILVGEKNFYQSIIRDITERKQMEGALRDSQTELSAIIEHAPIVMLLVDRERQVRKANSAAIKFAGHPAEEMIGLRSGEVLHCLHSLDDPRGCGFGEFCETCTVRNAVIDTLETGKSHYEVEAKLPFDLRGKPEEKYLLLSTIPLTIRKEQLVLVCIEDITERKRAEEALQKSEQKFRELFDNAPIGYQEHDLEGHISNINRTQLEMVGYSFEEMIGQSVWKFSAQEEGTREVVLAKLAGTMPPGQGFEGSFRRKDGTTFPVLIQERILRDAQGRITGMRTTIQDITERKQREEALRSSEDKYRTILENIDDGYYEVDIAGNLTFFNDSFCRIYGYPREELMGMNDRQYTDQENAKELFQTFNKVYRTGEPAKGFHWEIIRRDGAKRNIEASVSLMEDSSGSRIGFRGLVRDVTERKQIEQEKANLEEQLRQSQRIEAIGRLAGGIAHDFNNLLTVIKGYSQISLIDTKEGSPLKENLEEIKKAAERAADLTRQLLAFSRRQILEMKVLDLNSLLMDLDKMLHRLISEDIELITLLADDLGRVKTDPGWVEQIIMNLAVNARDAMPDGGKLTIETANMEMDEAYAHGHIAVIPGRYVMLSVSDTGVGMTPEVKQKVFEPFFTTKERGKGTGLGLSTVYGIVKQSGGNIWVYSEPGKGATFKIYLPRVDEPLEEYKKKGVKEELPYGSETIILVEDDEEVRKLALRILERQGYNVLEAPQGMDAFLIGEEYEGPIHLLLTDVVMPKMSGPELAGRLASIRPEIKVLYMSGYTDNAIVHHGVLDKGISYIQKPLTVEGLLRKVREVLDKDSNPALSDG